MMTDPLISTKRMMRSFPMAIKLATFMDDKHKLGKIVVTGDGSWTLAHAEHGETYHSSHGAMAEAVELYVGASDIKTRFLASATATSVLDVGLGLGYNALATIEAWLAAPAPGPLRIVSLEINADLVQALTAGAGPWQGNWSSERLNLARALGQNPIAHPSGGVDCTWDVVIGDALMANLTGYFNYVWQDPFSPTQNPSMWSRAWFQRVRSLAAPGCLLLTYSVARTVRDALIEAEWKVDRIPTGTGRKRHWLRAINTI